MIIAVLSGGVGNQIFQYAAAYSLSKKKNCKLIIDVSPHYHNVWEHEMRLDQIIDQNEIFIKNKWIARGIRIIFRIIDFMSFGKIKYVRIDEKDAFGFIKIPEASNYFLNGLFQNINYFDDYFDEFLKKFKVKLKKNVSNKTRIAIHPRKADLVDTEIDICKKDYYERALKEILKLENLNIHNIEIVIFCEELKWPKENLNFEGIKKSFIIGNDKTCIQDFKTMSNCSHIIISNSTYAWWPAAIIRKISNGRVICPDLWWNSIPINSLNIYPKDWTKIKTNQE